MTLLTEHLKSSTQSFRVKYPDDSVLNVLTCSHELVDFGRTPLRLLHAVTLLQEVVHLGEVDARVGRHAVGRYLPEEHPERWRRERSKD